MMGSKIAEQAKYFEVLNDKLKPQHNETIVLAIL